MRVCGECTLCCKLPRIEELVKPSWTVCKHCEVGKGCKIYKGRPDVCKEFTCNWLIDVSIPKHLRPDLIHMYAVGGRDHLVKIMVDPDYPGSIDTLEGQQLIEGYRSAGNHVLLICRDIVKFLCGHGREKPAKIMLDWIL